MQKNILKLSLRIKKQKSLTGGWMILYPESYAFLMERTGGTFNMGNKRSSEDIPPDMAIRNDHIKVPVISAIQPARMGDNMVPIPK